MKKPLILTGVFIMASIFGAACEKSHADIKQFPDPAIDLKVDPNAGLQKLVIAGGCFWCTEGVYEQIPGVIDVVSGYAGGSKETANYKAVTTGTTGHAEAIQITYDPAKTSMGQLLKVFFSIAHDPTQLNRQGADVGTQYRSAIFYANDDQKKVAEAYIKQLSDAKVFDDPIVTKLEKLDQFYVAEDYHQDYARLNPSQGYIRGVAMPKVEKAKKYAESQKATTQPAK
jgi:peptide-methionine (S)-S-oxide reductase